MSDYEDYGRAAANYDRTRVPIGLEIVIGCLARAPWPLAEMVVLDAGCGTGNYAAALLGSVATVVGVDASRAALRSVRQKFTRAGSPAGSAPVAGDLRSLPLADGSVHAVLANQVLHHLPLSHHGGFDAAEQALREFARVLRPGGTLVVQHCSQEQLRDGGWYIDLIPDAAAEIARRYVPIDALIETSRRVGFSDCRRFVPLDAVVQGEAYLDGRGPLSSWWRDGDSTWSLASDTELGAALERVRALDRTGALEQFVAERDALRRRIGQVTFVAMTRSPVAPPSPAPHDDRVA